MSHDPEVVKATATVLWDTEVPTWGDAVDMARALAAAGYTVTKERYEPATVWVEQATSPITGQIEPAAAERLWVQPDGEDVWIGQDAPAGSVPLYREIEWGTGG